MERYVECESRGLTLRGMLHVPDQRPGKVPFVILFHGFTRSSPAGCVSGGSPVSGSTLPAAATATGGSRT